MSPPDMPLQQACSSRAVPDHCRIAKTQAFRACVNGCRTPLNADPLGAVSQARGGRMKSCSLLPFLVASLLFAIPSAGSPLGIRVDVRRDSGAGFTLVGTAVGGGTTLDAAADIGDVLRFVISLHGTPDGAALTFYDTDIATDDPAEIDYVVGAGLDLTGLGFDRAPARHSMTRSRT